MFEEPDFSTTSALDDDNNSDYKTIVALQRLIMQNGENTAFARRLPYIFQEQGLSNIQAEGYVPINHGNSYLAEMHYRTTNHLKGVLIQSKLVQADTLDTFLNECHDSNHWTRECQVICISGQRLST